MAKTKPFMPNLVAVRAGSAPRAASQAIATGRSGSCGRLNQKENNCC
jgi:hypothetical protein